MSNTFNTNKSRIARQLNKKLLEKFNAHTGDTQIVEQEINKLEINGIRYGNHRQMKSEEKVTKKRNERHDLNNEAKREVSSLKRKF